MVVHIIEDDRAVADALAFALEDLDHLTRIYHDGESFQAQATLSEGDWVIVDLGLPGVSGAEIVRELNTLNAPPKMIAISGKSRMNIQRYIQELDGLTVLRKPLSIDMLSTAMA